MKTNDLFFYAKIFSLALAVIFLPFCSPSKKTIANTSTQTLPVSNNENTNGQILFLAFKIRKDSTTINAGETISLVNFQKVTGNLKAKIKTAEFVDAGDLVCEFLDKEKNVLSTEILEDPLTASVEYPDDNGSFKRINSDKKDADLFLRIQFTEMIYWLRINKLNQDRKPVLLAEFQIAAGVNN